MSVVNNHIIIGRSIITHLVVLISPSEVPMMGVRVESDTMGEGVSSMAL